MDNRPEYDGALFTIGYEGRSGSDVVALLQAGGVTTLADVRAVPMSRKPDFRKNAWAAILAEAGIRYYACPAIGTPKALRDRLTLDRDYASFFSDYRRYLRTQYEPLHDLRDLLHVDRVALMCFEADPALCHRSVVAERLARLTGLKAEHLGAPAASSVTVASGR